MILRVSLSLKVYADECRNLLSISNMDLDPHSVRIAKSATKKLSIAQKFTKIINESSVTALIK